MKPELTVLKGTYAICRLEADSDIQDWITDSEFISLTKTRDELSLVCRQDISVPHAIEISQDWRIIKLNGPLDFSLTGIIAGISGILAESNVPVFTISTWETDYFMVKESDLRKAIDSLKSNGYNIIMKFDRDDRLI
jgi:uncharacterized protein